MRSRRDFLRGATGLGLSIAGLRPLVAREGADRAPIEKLGALVEDPKGILDLPAGFEYRVVSQAGASMNDGYLTPGDPDGMAAFAGEGGKIILVRNHELSRSEDGKSPWGPGAIVWRRTSGRHFTTRAHRALWFRGGPPPSSSIPSPCGWSPNR